MPVLDEALENLGPATDSAESVHEDGGIQEVRAHRRLRTVRARRRSPSDRIRFTQLASFPEFRVVPVGP